MANTYSQIYIQTVFAVKYRAAMIDVVWKEELCAVIGNLINETGCTNYIVNGVEDHIHCFFALKPSISVSEVMKIAKSKSSKWINENNLTTQHFEWQVGYGAFSYTAAHKDNVYKYVKNQEEHHRTIKFYDEYIELLKQNQIPYEEQYLFDDLM
jgi:REP element-mobilizing transposase RayT